MRVVILANPVAGHGRARVLVPRLSAALRGGGMEVREAYTRGPGDARTLAGELAPERVDAVVSVGGDGTLNEILNGLPDPTLPLGVLPLGTANVLATELRLPRTPEALAALIQRGTLRELDLGLVGARRFLLFVGVGMDGAMVRRVAETRRGTLGKLKWIGPVLDVVRTWPSQALRLSLDGRDQGSAWTEILVSQVRNYGGVFVLPRPPAAATGRLTLFGFRQGTRARWLHACLRALAGRLRPGRDLVLLEGRAARIESDPPAPWQVDGEYGGTTPVEVRLDGRRARCFAPAPAAERGQG
ncbi:MAG: NAD(+)/NADH kinase [Planctomycetes bacterium]|nr:NAD(+)/NADH kinase [Planctomycetota bacterium]